MTQPGIATIVEPTVADFRRAIVTQAYHAREMLSLAERAAEDPDPKTGPALTQIDIALIALTSARTLLSEADAGPTALRIEKLLQRSIHGAEAARGHILRYRSYQDASTKLETDQLQKLRPIWRRSAEEAKKDVHRALLFLCERFPHAYEREVL